MFVSPVPLAATVAALRENRLDLFAYINETCDRIEEVEPHISALLPEPGRRERLLHEARVLRERFLDPLERPPLYGVLCGVKDIFLADGFPTHAGSLLPAALFEGPEAESVSRLRAAGALVLGKTVTTEFAYFEPGPTRNPHNPAHTPGGSSSGSAAAVAAGFCSLALGTQTIGSTIRPASFCGIVGFKPSYGRIPIHGVIPCSVSVDTVGFFTPDVAGIALAAPVLCDGWQAIQPAAETLPVLGLPDGPYLAQASPQGLAAFERQVTALDMAGYTVRRVQALADIEAINRRHQRMVFAEMAQAHRVWFARYESLYRERTAAAIREGQTVGDDELVACQASRERLRGELETLMEQYGVDMWICPAAPGTAPEGITTTGNAIMNLPWTHAGMPALSLPAGRAENGLPLGLQCVGRFMRDEYVVVYAVAIAEAMLVQ